MDLEAVWASWNAGEAVMNADGQATGMKPPLHIVEQQFNSKWRSEARVGSRFFFFRSSCQQNLIDIIKARKWYQHYREIPDYIDAQVDERRVSPDIILQELESMKITESDHPTIPLGTRALADHLAKLRKAKALTASSVCPITVNWRFSLSSEPLHLKATATSDTPSAAIPSGSPLSIVNTVNKPNKKRRAPTIGGRAKPKKSRTSAA